MQNCEPILSDHEPPDEGGEETEMDAEPEQEKPDEVVKTTRPKPLSLDDHGSLILKNNEDMGRVTDLWMRSEMLPAQFTPNDHWQQNTRYQVTAATARHRIFTAVQMLDALGFKFKQALPLLKFFAFVKGAIFIYGDLPLMIVERSDLLEDIEEHFFDKDHNIISFENKNLDADIWGALCRVKPKGRGWKEETYTIKKAIEAGQLPPGGREHKFSDAEKQRKFQDSAWYAHTHRMLRFRARGFALRDNFARTFADRVKVQILESDAVDVPAEFGSPEAARKAFTVPQAQDSRLDLNEIY